MIETLLAITLVCLVALLLVKTVLRHHPPARYFACLAALILALLTPALIALRHFTSFGLITLIVPQSGDTPTNVPAVASASPHSNWLFWSIGALWVAGCVVGALRFVRGWKEAARLKRGAIPIVVPAEVQNSVERILKRPLPPVYASPLVTSPVAVGLFAPVVILPEGWDEALSPLALRHVLLHESAHIALGHTLGGAIERLAGFLLWPHPMVRLLCLELARAREEVCDNVASQEAGAACYAHTLLALAQGTSLAPNFASTLALLGPETSLEARIAGLLNPRRNRMIRVSQGKLWAAGLAACALVSTVAVRVVAAEPKNGVSDKKQATPTIKVEKRDGKLAVIKADGKVVGVITPKGGGPATERKTLYRVELDKAPRETRLRAKQKAEAEAKITGVRVSGSLAKQKAEASNHWVYVTKKNGYVKSLWKFPAK